MRLNITDKDITMEDFKNLLNSATNLKDVHLVCHQAGCPVYAIRDIDDKCAIIWHPSKDDEKNVIKIVVTNGIGRLVFDGETHEFNSIGDLRKKNSFTSHILGDDPFDVNYLVWSRETHSETN